MSFSLKGCDYTELITKEWLNPEELRNATGIVLMRDGETQRDTICTCLYDFQKKRSMRWPYKNTGKETTTHFWFVDFWLNSFHMKSRMQ